MKLNFSFNTSTHDFWEIYDAINKYYPIGLDRKEGKGIYSEYKGIKDLERIVMENIHDKVNFQERWLKFTEQIGITLNKEVIDKTFGQAPSFSSSIILKKNPFQDGFHVKTLHFSVSLVGNFYQIYGLDSTTVLRKKKKEGEFPRYYNAVNLLTTSPFEDFQESFEFVEQKIQERFPEYRMVPFAYGQSKIRGLQVSYLNDEDCSVNKALFNQFLSEENISRAKEGDQFYGKDMWKIE